MTADRDREAFEAAAREAGLALNKWDDGTFLPWATVAAEKIWQAALAHARAADFAKGAEANKTPHARKQKWAAEMTDEEIIAEMRALDARIDNLKAAMSDPEFGMGGSPGEALYERYDELEAQAKKRALPLPTPAGEG